VTRKVAIVGFGKGFKTWREARRAGYEIWGINDPLSTFGPWDADRWYQLHSAEYLEEHWPYWDAVSKDTWLNHWKYDGSTPLYMQRHYPEFPGSVEFPKKRIEEELPNGRYHCGTFDWLVAHAILEGVTHIRLCGVTLHPVGEPLSARACLEFWLGMAMGRGIEVEVESEDLFYTFNLVRTRWQYGFDESRPIIEVEDVAKSTEALDDDQELARIKGLFNVAG